MKGKLIAFLSLPVLTLILLTFAFPVSTSAACGESDHKIDICHATSSTTNPYNKINVDKNATVNGHDGHGEDIVPPFTYTYWGITDSHYEYDWKHKGKCPNGYEDYGNPFYCRKLVYDEGWVTASYAGKNWTTEGQAIWNNDCNIPNCLYTSTITGDWSDWSLDTTTYNRELRTREITVVDASHADISCAATQIETEYRPIPECKYQSTEYGVWSAWELDPSDNTQQISTRTVFMVDTYGSAICGTSTETRTKATPRCEYTTEVTGEWSEWELNSDNTYEEIRTREISQVDAVYGGVCHSNTETETQDTPTCKYTTEVVGEWSDWETDPEDPSFEIRSRIIDTYDTPYENLCATRTEIDDRQTPACTNTTTLTGEWSDWTVDNEDPTKEVRTRTITVVDSEDNTIVCSDEVQTEKETRDRIYCTGETLLTETIWGAWTVDPSDPTQEYQIGTYTEVDADDPSVVCGTFTTDPQRRTIVVEDDEGEVKGITDTTVVPADTSASLNIWVYVAEAFLVALTSVSLVFLTKEYLKKNV